MKATLSEVQTGLFGVPEIHLLHEFVNADFKPGRFCNNYPGGESERKQVVYPQSEQEVWNFVMYTCGSGNTIVCGIPAMQISHFCLSRTQEIVFLQLLFELHYPK